MCEREELLYKQKMISFFHTILKKNIFILEHLKVTLVYYLGGKSISFFD